MKAIRRLRAFVDIPQHKRPHILRTSPWISNRNRRQLSMYRNQLTPEGFEFPRYDCVCNEQAIQLTGTFEVKCRGRPECSSRTRRRRSERLDATCSSLG